MARYKFNAATGVAGATTYRFDTAELSDTPATIYPVGGATAVTGSKIRSEPDGTLPPFEAATGTLYRKALTYAGAVTGSAVTLTGTLLGQGGTAGDDFATDSELAAAVAAASATAAQKSANLSDLTSASTARTSLGLGTAATQDVGLASGQVAAADDWRFTNRTAIQQGPLTTIGDVLTVVIDGQPEGGEPTPAVMLVGAADANFTVTVTVADDGGGGLPGTFTTGPTVTVTGSGPYAVGTPLFFKHRFRKYVVTAVGAQTSGQIHEVAI